MQAQNPQFPEISDLISTMQNLADLVTTLIEVSLKKDRPAPDNSREMQAIVLLMEIGARPREIARRLGLSSHRALYRLPKFMRYYKPMAEAQKAEAAPRNPRKGFRKDDGSLESED